MGVKLIEHVRAARAHVRMGRIGADFGDGFDSFEAFYAAVKEQLAMWTDAAVGEINAIEARYPGIVQAPVLSATYEDCMETGIDVYAGGAKYNNSSLCAFGIATAVDALAAIRKAVFEDKTVGGSIPKEFIEPVRKGIEEAAKNGILAGYEVVDFKATVYDGSYHEVDSSEIAFKIAGSMAFKDGVKRAKPVILEPIMKVEIVTPEDYFGDLMGDVSSRRGNITGTDDRNGAKIIDAEIPLSEMFGYATDLRSRTQGRGQYTMQFSHYNEVPKSVAEKIIGERAVKDN